MKPWTLGGEYDRPIARRIAEEAGIPRELFGQQKKGGPWSAPDINLSPADNQDFLEFYRTKVSKNTGKDQPLRGRRGIQKRIINRLRPLGKLLGPSAHRKLRFIIGDRLDPRLGSKDLYRFHWGFERTKERYQSVLSQNG
jgi:hypothetical protein